MDLIVNKISVTNHIKFLHSYVLQIYSLNMWLILFSLLALGSVIDTCANDICASFLLSEL